MNRYDVSSLLGENMRTAGIHRGTWGRGSDAAGGARAATAADASDRRAHPVQSGRHRGTRPPDGIRAGPAAIGLDRRPKHPVDYRWGDGNPATMRKFANELVSLVPDAILANSSAAVLALLEATRTVPIVFAVVADPVGASYVESLSRPGGNATGFTVFEYGISAKWLELLKELVPNLTRAAVVRDAAIAAGIGQFAAIQTVAPSFGVELSAVNVRDKVRSSAP